MKHIFLFAAAAVIALTTRARAQEAFPALTAHDTDGLRILSETEYDGSSLWGYIDGGADVYLEYGFSRLCARKVDVNGTTFQVDLYRMHDPESAFGIFSISAFTCTLDDSLHAPHCISRYQVQAACGAYYLSIIKERGTEDAGRVMLMLARQIVSQIDAPPYRLPALFEIDALRGYPGSVKFIRGRLGLENGMPAWESLFLDGVMISVYVMDVRTSACDMSLAEIIFGRKDEETEFMARAGFHTLPIRGRQQRVEDNIMRCVWKIDDTRLFYLEVKTDRHRQQEIVDAVDAFYAVY